MEEIDECEMAICRTGAFTDEQLIKLLMKGRLIMPEWLEDNVGRGRQDNRIQVGIITLDEGGKPVKIILSCHELVSLINYIAKEALQ